jgi:hypothetical protein
MAGRSGIRKDQHALIAEPFAARIAGEVPTTKADRDSTISTAEQMDQHNMRLLYSSIRYRRHGARAHGPTTRSQDRQAQSSPKMFGVH